MSDNKLADGMIVNRRHLDRALAELETTVEMIHSGHIPSRSIVSALRDNCRDLRNVRNGNVEQKQPERENHPAGSRLPPGWFERNANMVYPNRIPVSDDQVADMRKRGINVIITDGPESGGA